jgi:hypothetical protein
MNEKQLVPTSRGEQHDYFAESGVAGTEFCCIASMKTEHQAQWTGEAENIG